MDGSKDSRRRSRLFGEGKVMHQFFPDVWELVSSVLHVLSGRGWSTAMWTVHSQQLAAMAGDVLGESLAPRG